jgi:hypothetical protein|nr:hypothetical protein [uncultured Alistipes sp.]
MKKSIRTLLAAMTAAALLTGCAAQTKTQMQQQDAALHLAAMQALEAGRYVVDIDDIYGPKGQHLNVSHSYFRITEEGALLNLSPKVYQESPFRRLSSLRTDYKHVRTVGRTLKKNGDLELALQITADPHWMRAYYLIVTLYADSDQCAVRMGHARGQNHLCTFRGRLRPA